MDKDQQIDILNGALALLRGTPEFERVQAVRDSLYDVPPAKAAPAGTVPLTVHVTRDGAQYTDLTLYLQPGQAEAEAERLAGLSRQQLEVLTVEHGCQWEASDNSGDIEHIQIESEELDEPVEVQF